MGDLDGKVAIVTGAGRLRSIGRATAVALARRGADVVVTGTGRDPDTFPDDEKQAGWRDVESTAEQVRAEGRRALALVSDACDEAQVRRVADTAVAELGRIDILVNNAAFPYGPDRVPLLDVDSAIFKRVLDIKVFGTFLNARAAAKVMIEQGEGGKIVNLSSAAGKRGSPNTLAYNAANFAIVGMTQSLAKELGPHGINVNAVCPGLVNTSRLDPLGRGQRWNEMAATSALGRHGEPEEVAGLIAHLCTDAASWINGQSINIDGGMVTEH